MTIPSLAAGTIGYVAYSTAWSHNGTGMESTVNGGTCVCWMRFSNVPAAAHTLMLEVWLEVSWP